MSRTQLGNVIKSLRREHIDLASGSSWTQRHLAEATNLSQKVISNIERGERRKIDASELEQLADGLKLSTLERREFFLAATEISQEDFRAKSPSAHDSAFAHVSQILTMTQCPAYLFDPLFNLIGINRSMMAFRGLTDELLDSTIRSELGANILGMLFREKSVLRHSVGPKWDVIAQSNTLMPWPDSLLEDATSC